jgi:hypothetical protein
MLTTEKSRVRGAARARADVGLDSGGGTEAAPVIERDGVLGFGEEQPRQHGNRRSMAPMASFRLSVFR